MRVFLAALGALASLHLQSVCAKSALCLDPDAAVAAGATIAGACEIVDSVSERSVDAGKGEFDQRPACISDSPSGDELAVVEARVDLWHALSGKQRRRRLVASQAADGSATYQLDESEPMLEMDVVFHVIHDGNFGRLQEWQLHEQVAVMNQAFSGVRGPTIPLYQIWPTSVWRLLNVFVFVFSSILIHAPPWLAFHLHRPWPTSCILMATTFYATSNSCLVIQPPPSMQEGDAAAIDSKVSICSWSTKIEPVCS
jgi:hypothetical protein